jgi:glucosaminylphosphatidylinositol acyltransferase
MANFPFVLFSLMCGLLCLIGLLLIEFYVRDQKVSVLLRAINRNQLILFLVANLMTGGVNLVWNTLETSDFAAVGILAAYMFLYGLIAAALDFFNVVIKL